MIQCETVQGLVRAMQAIDPPYKWRGFPVLADALQEFDERLLSQESSLFTWMREKEVNNYHVGEIMDIVSNYPIHGYEWKEAFAYAGEPDGYNSPSVKAAKPGDTVSADLFARKNVVEIVAMDAGENDERPWLCVGRLDDGRWFALDAGCDYTGWDRQSWGAVAVATTKDDIIRFGLSSEARARLGLLIPGLDDNHS